MSKARVIKKLEAPLKLDLGCGRNPQTGFVGVDSIKYPEVSVVADLAQRWPWEGASADEIHCSHTIEHFTAEQRVHFMNEMYRVMKLDAKATLIAPHWASCRAYGDFTHKYPPVSEFWFYYLSREWRKTQAPHTDIEWNPAGYDCNFECTWGYSLHALVAPRNQEYQMFALNFYKEAAQDIICTMIKRA